MTKRKTNAVGEAAKVTGISAAALAALLALSPVKELKPPKIVSGPIYAHVLKITDSDSFKVKAYPWPGSSEVTTIRVYGIDTPEKFRPKCDLEKEKALAATEFVKERIKVGDLIMLSDLFDGKFGGRTVGNVHYEDFTGAYRNIGDELISTNQAVAYFGKTKTKDWCAE